VSEDLPEALYATEEKDALASEKPISNDKRHKCLEVRLLARNPLRTKKVPKSALGGPPDRYRETVELYRKCPAPKESGCEERRIAGHFR
jgi:hypothetical protein